MELGASILLSPVLGATEVGSKMMELRSTLSPVQEVTRNGARMQDDPPCLYTGIIVMDAG